MKKVLTALSLSTILGLSMAAIIFTNKDNSVQPQLAKAEPSGTSMDIEEVFPKSNRPEDSVIRNADAGYWDPQYTYGALSKFYDAVDVGEGRDASVSSIIWKQTTQYFSFQWGAAFNANCSINFHYYSDAEGNNSLGTSNYKNHTEVGNPMMVHYHKIDDAIYEANKDSLYVRIELVDNAPGNGDYSYHLFGHLTVNQTLEQVGSTMRQYFTSLSQFAKTWENEMTHRIKAHYYGNEFLRTAFSAGNPNADYDLDENFEDRDSFYSKWYFDHSYFQYSGDNLQALQFDKVISYDSYRPDGGVRMPFNQDGNGFFRGWYETGDGQNSGFINDDRAIYRFRSAPLKLHENHFVSIKMAGTASFHIFDATTNAELAFIDSRAHNPNGDWFMYKGFNTCTLKNHVINLSAFAGKTVSFAIADISAGGWGTAYFDAFDCDFDVTSGVRADVVEQVLANEEKFYCVYSDVYVPCVNNLNGDGIDYKTDEDYPITEDNSHYKAAHAFVMDYRNFARNVDNRTSMCAVIETQEMRELLTRYNGLSLEAKTIVNASDDYHHQALNDGEEWFRFNPLMLNLGEQLVYISNEIGFDISSPLASRSLLLSESTSAFVFMSAPIVVIVLVLVAFFFINKRRKAIKNK